jgi:O-antigen ligase
MKLTIKIIINIILIIFMPFMLYININNSNINISIGDFVLLFIGIIFLFNLKEFIIQKKYNYLFYFIGLLISIIISQILSMYDKNFVHASYQVMLLEIIKTIIIATYFFSALIFVNNSKMLKIALISISLGSIPVIFIGLWAYISYLNGKDFFITTYKINYLRFFGSFEDPNLCALYFIMIFFISLLNFQILEHRIIKKVSLGISILSLVMIGLTISRGGWIAIFGALLIFFALNIKNVKKESLIIFFIIFAFILGIINLDFIVQNGRITKQLYSRVKEASIYDVKDNNRIQLLNVAIQMGNEKPIFGVGRGSFPLNSDRYISENSYQYNARPIPHNTIFGFYAQQGIVGVILFILLPGYALYRMLKSKRKQNRYLIPLFIAFIFHSMTINIENIRFVWYIMGIIMASEINDINLDFNPSIKMNKKYFVSALITILGINLIFYYDLSRKLAFNIKIFNGDIYEKTIDESGDYILTLDVQTDKNMHNIEVYDGNLLVKRIELNSAFGMVKEPIHIEEKAIIKIICHKEGWVNINNAYMQKTDKLIPIYDYVLLPDNVEDFLNDKGKLVYIQEPSFKTDVSISKNQLEGIQIINAKITKYSNLTNLIEYKSFCNEIIKENYQMELLFEYDSISSLQPLDLQRNSITRNISLQSQTSLWEEKHIYKNRVSILLTSNDFQLYGRYYDYTNKIYSQDSYFPIYYESYMKNQDIINQGKSNWINIRYNIHPDKNVYFTSNGWVETGRMNLSPGDHDITFSAQGSFYNGEYSKVRVRDSYLNVVDEFYLDDTMKEYTVKYHTEEEKEGISFLFELINYEGDKNVGSREVLLDPQLSVN